MFAREPTLSKRPPAVAGSFYPRGLQELEDTVKSLMSEAKKSGDSGLVGVVAPHAGYMYSGPVAASAFAVVAAPERAFERVLLIGPPHFVPVRSIATPSSSGFTTPLGEIAVDTNAIAALVEAGLVGIDDAPMRRNTPSRSSCPSCSVCLASSG
jgi:AmmeMemoRadiSam system protein B